MKPKARGEEQRAQREKGQAVDTEVEMKNSWDDHAACRVNPHVRWDDFPQWLDLEPERKNMTKIDSHFWTTKNKNANLVQFIIVLSELGAATLYK